MLTEEAAKILGYKKQFRSKMQSPSFVVEGSLWNKSKCTLPIPHNIVHKKHTFCYNKKGKTFGFQVKRYIEYVQGLLLYFEEENDSEYKGYCQTQNLYMYYLPIDNQFLMHLTNGNEWSQFYFNDNSFYNSVSAKLRKDVIQLNFYQKYSLLELLGKGTYSKVYLARNKETDCKYAAKFVSKKDKNGSCTKNIVDEQKKIFRILNTQRACRMEQFFQDEETFIFVLELLTGKDLMMLYRQKYEFTLQELISIFKGVLQGLSYMHSKNIMHRDLKPQNIMIDDLSRAPKLIDFGLSLIFGPKTDKKRYKRCGTMGYMAFQVINNTVDKKKSYDCKCDMFSFGIIAHMMLLGYNPLKGKNYTETVQKNEECNILLEKEHIIAKYGYSCLIFLNGLLQKDPAKRMSAEEALHSDFMKQEFKNDSGLFKHQVQETTQLKEQQAQFQQQQEPVSIPKFQNFVPNKMDMENRI